MKKYEKPQAVVTEYRVKSDIALQEYYYKTNNNVKMSLFDMRSTSDGTL